MPAYDETTFIEVPSKIKHHAKKLSTTYVLLFVILFLIVLGVIIACIYQWTRSETGASAQKCPPLNDSSYW